MRSSIVLFTTTPEYLDGKPMHSYMGSWLGQNTIYYVKSYKDGQAEITLDRNNAKHFTNDGVCTKCMEHIIATRNPWTIAVWEYKDGRCIANCVHYPNKHWSENNNLQPSLMNMSVSEFWLYKEKSL